MLARYWVWQALDCSTLLALREEAVPSTESCDTMTVPILYALLMLALATVAVAFSFRGLVALRARRRAAWELDRAEWRRWLTRV